MDEMLFVFCDPEDRVLNARQMNDAHHDYLKTIGFEFVRNRFDVYRHDNEEGTDAGGPPSNIFERIRDQPYARELADFFPPGAELDPFAVLPGAADVAQRYGLSTTFPSQEVIRRVNTKSYSLQMRDQLGIENVGTLIEDIGSLLELGALALQNGPFLLKDDYGVSGKGNQIVEHERTLQRIAKYLSAQVAKGKRIRFVLEPYLPKQIDFSCQFRVSVGGQVNLISVQQLENNGLAFGTSCSPSVEVLEKLDDMGYFVLIEKIGRALSSDGYYGDVCVDSMLLDNDDWAPLVEINARKSMSLIKNAVDRHLTKLSRFGCLTSVAALNDGSTGFAKFLDLLQSKRILFEAGGDLGIIPLTSGTLFPAGKSDSVGPLRGKFYIAVVSDTVGQRASLLTALNGAMEQAGMRVKH